MNEEEKKIQIAIGTKINPLNHLCCQIAAEFNDATEEELDELMDEYALPCGDTAYFSPEKLKFPIKDVNDFYRKLLDVARKKRDVEKEFEGKTQVTHRKGI